MTRGTRRASGCALLTLLLALVAATGASAQIRFDRGQNVAPVFEGWEQNPDGSFNMVFGYMNRNYEEMPHAPIGPNNAFEPARPIAASRRASTRAASSSCSECTCQPIGATRT